MLRLLQRPVHLRPASSRVRRFFVAALATFRWLPRTTTAVLLTVAIMNNRPGFSSGPLDGRHDCT